MSTTLPQVKTFPADASALSDLRGFVRARAEEAALAPSTTSDLLVAVTEACSELLTHERGPTLVVSWWTHDGMVEIRVKDDGVIELPRQAEGIDDEGDFSNGGLGFPYILAFIDEYDVSPRTEGRPNTVVRLAKETSPA